MPGVYAPGQWDLAGCCIGVRKDPSKSGIAEGDILIGLDSNGLHSNGFSLVRKIVESLPSDTTCPWDRHLLLSRLVGIFSQMIYNCQHSS